MPKLTNLDGVCRAIHGLPWCECDSIAEQMAELPAVLSSPPNGQVQVACSGVAIGPSTVATAAHCVADQEGFVIANYTTAAAKVRDSEVCVPEQSVFKIVRSESSGYGVGGTRLGDVAILRVEPLRRGAELAHVPVCPEAPSMEKEPHSLRLFGHPLGLPQFLSDRGVLLDVEKGDIKTSLDALDGYSGGPIFSERDQCVLAIHRASNHGDTKPDACCRFVSTSLYPPYYVSAGKSLFGLLPKDLKGKKK